MKNKIINLLITMALCALLIYLRPKTSATDSIRIIFFVGCIVFFIKGFIRFVLKKQGGLIAYISMLYNKLKEFINTQARDYKTIAWYKKPKYWLLFILLIFHVATTFYYGGSHIGIMNVLFQCVYAAPILLFIFIGRAFPFVILFINALLRYLYWNPITILDLWRYSYPISAICWILWSFVFMLGLITVCIIIEIKRQKQPLWKQFLKGLGMCFLYVAYYVGVWSVKDAFEIYTAKRTFIEKCMKNYKRPNIEDKDLEKYCSEMFTNLLNQLKQIGNK